MTRLLSLLALCALAAPAQEAASRAVTWASSSEAAYQAAKERGVPVLWVVMMDKEIACTRMLNQVYTSPGVIKKTAEFVLIPCSKYQHEAISIERGGEVILSCPQFPGITCSQHKAAELEMRTRFASTDTDWTIAPQHVITGPDGKLLLRKEYELKAGELIALLDRGLRIHKGLPEEPDKPAEGETAPGERPSDEGLRAMIEKLLAEIETAPAERKVEAAEELLGHGSADANIALVQLLVEGKVKPVETAFDIIRAAGRAQYGGAASPFSALLASKQKQLRNATVVTLEEMANPEVAPALLALWEKDKDPEIRKDILRALGPAGVGNPEARTLLLKNLRNPSQPLRIGAIMSLGSILSGDEEVRTALKETYRRESRGNDGKAAIYYAYWLAKDSTLLEDVDALKDAEKNGDMRELAELVRVALGGAPDEEAALRGGGGRGGRGGGGGGAPGGAWRIYRFFAPLYAKDKIQRNLVKEFQERFARGR